MGSFVDTDQNTGQTAACEACADEVVSWIPILAEERGLPTGRVAQAVWLALFRDLVGTEAEGPTVEELFALARLAMCGVPVEPK